MTEFYLEEEGRFADELLNLAPPDDPRERIEIFARSLAHGAVNGYWSPQFKIRGSNVDGWECPGDYMYGVRLKRYLSETWRSYQPDPSFLLGFGYFTLSSERTEPTSGTITRYYLLTPAAFALLEKPLHSKVFISYRRSESSAFALLLYDRLREASFDAFLDMQGLEPGREWLEQLKAHIGGADVFVCLLGPTTLLSEVVREEIHTAFEQGITVIPMFHNGYHTTIRDELAERLADTHAIVVEPEHVLGYDNAVRQLLQHLHLTTERM